MSITLRLLCTTKNNKFGCVPHNHEIPWRKLSLQHYSLHRHPLVNSMFLKFNTDNETYQLLLPWSKFFHLQVWFFRKKNSKGWWCWKLFGFFRTKLQCIKLLCTEYNINNDCSGGLGLLTVYHMAVQSELLLERVLFDFLTWSNVL